MNTDDLPETSIVGGLRINWRAFFARTDIRADADFCSLPAWFRAHYGWS